MEDEDFWQYQLLREKDIVGQYEAIQALKLLESESAYEGIKQVIESTEYFYKIREEAIKALGQMNTKNFNKYLSTERFFIKAYTNYEKKLIGNIYNKVHGNGDTPKYLDSVNQYYIDKVLIGELGKQRSSSKKIQNLGDQLDYNMKLIKNFSGKDMNHFLVENLKKQYSTKAIFDISGFVAMNIKACGNCIQMKMLHETVHEICRQAEVDIARSKTLKKQVMGSHNCIILKACMEALSTIYDNCYPLKKQMEKNKAYWKKQRHDEAEIHKKDKETKSINKKIQTEIDNIHRISRELPIIRNFMKKISELEIYEKTVDLKILGFRFECIQIFSENDCVTSFYKILKIINEEIVLGKVDTATAFVRNFKELICERIFEKQDLDYRELINYHSEKTNAIYDILWDMATLDFTFLNSKFRQEITSIIWIFFREVKLTEVELDPTWHNFDQNNKNKRYNPISDDRSHGDGASLSNRRKLADNKSDVLSDHYSVSKYTNGRKSKNIIKLSTFMNAPNAANSRMEESANRSEISYNSEAKGFRDPNQAEESQKVEKNNQNLIDIEGLGWKDACLKIIEKMEEFEESEDFRQPVTKEEVGEEYWGTYCELIDYHVDFNTIKYRILEGECKGVNNFEYDMRKVFANCKKFNDPSSSIYE